MTAQPSARALMVDLDDLIAQLEDEQDIGSDGGPNEAMRFLQTLHPVRQSLDSLPALVAELERLREAAQFALSNLHRNLQSEQDCGQPFMGDDEHEAIRLLTAALTQPGGQR